MVINDNIHVWFLPSMGNVWLTCSLRAFCSQFLFCSPFLRDKCCPWVPWQSIGITLDYVRIDLIFFRKNLSLVDCAVAMYNCCFVMSYRISYFRTASTSLSPSILYTYIYIYMLIFHVTKQRVVIGWRPADVLWQRAYRRRSARTTAYNSGKLTL